MKTQQLWGAACLTPAVPGASRVCWCDWSCAFWDRACSCTQLWGPTTVVQRQESAPGLPALLQDSQSGLWQREDPAGPAGVPPARGASPHLRSVETGVCRLSHTARMHEFAFHVSVTLQSLCFCPSPAFIWRIPPFMWKSSSPSKCVFTPAGFLGLECFSEVWAFSGRKPASSADLGSLR